MSFKSKFSEDHFTGDCVNKICSRQNYSRYMYYKDRTFFLEIKKLKIKTLKDLPVNLSRNKFLIFFLRNAGQFAFLQYLKRHENQKALASCFCNLSGVGGMYRQSPIFFIIY